MEYLLLGHMEVCAAGRPLSLGGIKQRAVLAILLLNAGTCGDVDRLTELVWDDNPPAKPITSLRAYVANLRRTLDDAGGGRRLITDATGYRLDTRTDTVDITTFERLTASGRKALTVADPVAAERDLKAAVDLWRGPALADFRHQRFADNEIHRLGALRSVATEGYFEAGLLLGRDTELIAGLEDQLAIDPLHERVWGQLMLALYRSGRRAEALRAYRARTELDTELGVRPGVALERLREDIANQSPDLEYAPLRVEISPVAVATEQRQGLVGRSAELTRLKGLLDRMALGHGSVAVIRGASGMGKTTLASAVIDDGTSRGMASAWSGQPDGVREPPMWAWVHIIRRLSERADPAALEQAHIVATVIFQSFGSHDGAHTSHLTAEALESRFEAPTEIALVIALLIGHTPTIVVLDDLHRADVFDRLLSRPGTTVIALKPLTDQSLRDLVLAETGVEASAAFVDSLRKRTGGPFYVCELVRLLHTQGHLHPETTTVELAGMPDAVVGVVRRRMFDLPKRTREALGIAGMIGVGVESQLLAEVLETTGAELRSRLAPACRIGLLSVSTGLASAVLVQSRRRPRSGSRGIPLHAKASGSRPHSAGVCRPGRDCRLRPRDRGCGARLARGRRTRTRGRVRPTGQRSSQVGLAVRIRRHRRTHRAGIGDDPSTARGRLAPGASSAPLATARIGVGGSSWPRLRGGHHGTHQRL
ncbi:AfsR/SARP family transcriptional regulator [Williamsia sp. 1135]|uniref:AfsR/SARP family transcriptional regulator n=1 Tax=Williamsia sp. 1135 TaxID=1889262 RepID=UPI000A0F64B8|nr:AfsR/SARP family transcriptional regulator [Williamsia sp. 1135]ORM28681.1 hypothetical protein BFL43_20630 [Williamsia sp. 1135]